MPVGRVLIVRLGVLFVALEAAICAAADWPQWGGRDCRNLVSSETGLPDSFEPGKKRPSGGGIDMKTTKNVRWAARLGSAAYGNTTVAAGRVYVGTDDLTLDEDPRFTRSRGGLVKCLDEATGELVWQLAVPQRKDLPEGIHFSHQHLGICSSPTVDGDRVYVVSSAGDVVCLDAAGQADGNDGPFTEEGRYMVGPEKEPVKLKKTDGDVLWRFDPIDELDVYVHDAASCSVLIHGDMLYVGTSNGVDAPHDKVINPEAPSLIVLDKRSGRLVAVDDAKSSSSAGATASATPSRPSRRPPTSRSP
ncbi:MAG: outer membrane protein assembly factor BamB family protein [Planctomycetota bacterium]